MFPSNDLPKIVNKNSVVSGDVQQKNNKHRLSIPVRHVQFKTLFCMFFIVFVITLAVFIGLISVFLPKASDNIPVISTVETFTLTHRFSLTLETVNALFLNNNSLIANYYLNGIQKNIFKACLQIRLHEDDRTKQMIILSIDNAHVQYSVKNQTKLILRRKRRQLSSQIDQVDITFSVQCNPSISKLDCQQYIESVLENGESLTCTSVDEMMVETSSTTLTTVADKRLTKIQHWRQVGQIFLAFGLTSLVGLERQLRGKNAGLRTHSMVGTTSALILQVSKYGFTDVIHEGMVVLDPSRIAAQIISGISFLGAGLIITRQRAIRGLTTAASVWSAAAIGMAAGSGLWVISLAVTGLHFIILLGFLPTEKRLPVFDKNSPFYLKPHEPKDTGDDDDDDDDDEDNDNQSV
ncbi:hypothetical protein I4U23_011913 [Adineta vaga]|nr:hypothetical protein I4U23_011913 [Adineta vaga]